jgi:hypothetical protein
MAPLCDVNGWRGVDHGDLCDCMALALAVGASPAAVDFNYCHHVLQKHWRLKCNHGCRGPSARVTPKLPALDPADPLQAVLLANAPVSA